MTSVNVRHILGRNVRYLRADARLNKVEFCLMAHISRPLLDAIEDGRANVTLDTLERIASSLAVEPWALLK